jgi:hypothetical protein
MRPAWGGAVAVVVLAGTSAAGGPGGAGGSRREAAQARARGWYVVRADAARRDAVACSPYRLTRSGIRAAHLRGRWNP